MTRDKYLEMMEQLGQEPKEDEIPPDIDDLPEIISIAVTTYNSLGDRVYPDIGFIGKDYTNLPLFLEMYGVDDTEYFLELLHWLDTRAIKTSSDKLKKEYDKLKRKTSGK